MKHDTAMNPNIFSRFGASKKPNTHTHTHTQKKSNWKREKKFIIILIITIIIIRSEVRKRCVFSRSPWNDFLKNISFFLSFLFFFVGVQLRRESRNLAAVSLLPLVSSSFFFSFLFFLAVILIVFLCCFNYEKKKLKESLHREGKKMNNVIDNNHAGNNKIKRWHFPWPEIECCNIAAKQADAIRFSFCLIRNNPS